MIEFAKKLGALDYYIKPSNMDDLLNLCRQLILGLAGHSGVGAGTL